MNNTFTPVYLTDLKEIVNLYLSQNKFEKLQADFGLPLYKLMEDNKIIAYSYVIDNNHSDLSFKVLSSNATISTSTSDHLLNYTRNYETVSDDRASLPIFINRMIDWLNHSV